MSGEGAIPEPADAGDADDGVTEVEMSDELPQESVEDALEPLEKWTDDLKDVFRGLPAEVQQAWLNREKDVERYLTKETQSLSESKRRYERIDKVLSPYEQHLSQAGVELAPHLANALQYYFAYQQDPLATVKSLIQNAKLSQDRLFSEEYDDPSLRALRAELDETKQALAKLQGRASADETSQHQSQIDEFKNATDDEGNLKHPHFEEVRTRMVAFVQDGKSLDEAYQEAIWTLPEYRKAQLEAREKEVQKKLNAARAEKARKAKAAGSTTAPSDVSKGSGLPKMNGDWKAALKHTLSNMQE